MNNFFIKFYEKRRVTLFTFYFYAIQYTTNQPRGKSLC
nr:MAG TPA: hypothetical protein [Caudoviricetes sp.]